jgi:hypothetical protein
MKFCGKEDGGEIQLLSLLCFRVVALPMEIYSPNDETLDKLINFVEYGSFQCTLNYRWCFPGLLSLFLLDGCYMYGVYILLSG